MGPSAEVSVPSVTTGDVGKMSVSKMPGSHK